MSLDIKSDISEEIYSRLEKEADKEVALAMQFQLIDQYKQERYYQRRQLLSSLLSEFEYFQNKRLLYTPTDIVDILFEAKLLFAVQSEKEFDQRRGGGRFFSNVPFLFLWTERSQNIKDIIEKHLQDIALSIRERTLITEISNFNIDKQAKFAYGPKNFFINLFSKLSLPFYPFFYDSSLINEHKRREPNLTKYTKKVAKSFFNSPSFGYTTIGTPSYVYLNASAQLRAFFNLLRVAGFLYKGQVDFGMWKVEMLAPTISVFLEDHSSGSYYWEQDKKKPWEKVPDGSLYISFGYRGLSKVFLDERTFGGIEKCFIDNKIIFEKLTNPWTKISTHEIATSLDILSSAVQMPDLGAKILQIYCCLEHLFVPQNVGKNNVAYITGAINALKPELLPWFNELYLLRCDYAHKGFIQRTENTLSLVFKSVENTVILITSKLSNN